MNTESFNVVHRAVQADDFDFAAVARPGINFANVEGATEDFVNLLTKLSADYMDVMALGLRFRSVLTPQLFVRAVGLEVIGGGTDESIATSRGTFADVRHSDGFIRVGAQATENAFGQIELRGALAVVVFVTDRVGRTNRGGGSGIFPIWPINLRPAARTARNLRRRLRKTRSHDAGA